MSGTLFVRFTLERRFILENTATSRLENAAKKMQKSIKQHKRARVKPHPERLYLERIDASLKTVEEQWEKIDDELELRGIGRKDTPFTDTVRMRMMSAYSYLDELLAQRIPPFSSESIAHILLLNERVHYGTDQRLFAEYVRAREATAEKFYQHIWPLRQWYEEHRKHGDHPLKLAAEIYVSILGYPQLYIEGNHRTGALVANWITMYYGFPPFVLSADNAIAYFAPSAEIKSFADRSTWRGRARLPKYRKSFLTFWQHHIDSQYLRKIEADR